MPIVGIMGEKTYKETKKIKATRELLEASGDKPDQIDKTLNLIYLNEQDKKWENIRSWAGAATGIAALIVSILVAIFK